MPVHRARAFWVVAPGRGAIRDASLPTPGAQEVLVRTRYSAISRGTERLVFEGRVPPSEARRMRAPFQEGDFPAPVKYGYCNVGVVEAGPDGWPGRSVFALAPHQTHYVVPVDAVTPIPADVPPARAVLAANMETALNGVWDAAIRPGDRVVVIGAGTVGSLAAWLARRIIGCEVTLVDIDEARATVAAALEVPFATPAHVPADADVVLHASGSGAGLALALRVAGTEATIVELSWYGDAAVSLPLGEDFHAKRLCLRSSQVGMVATAQRARWTYRRRMALALSLLSAPALDALIGSESAFDDLPETMARVCAPGHGGTCHRIRYPERTSDV